MEYKQNKLYTGDRAYADDKRRILWVQSETPECTALHIKVLPKSYNRNVGMDNHLRQRLNWFINLCNKMFLLDDFFKRSRN
jgi:hypothetical protein